MEKRIYILEINMEVEYSQEHGLNEECDLASVNVQNKLKTLASLYHFQISFGSLQVDPLPNSKTKFYRTQQLILTKQLVHLESVAHFAMLFQAASRLIEVSELLVLQVSYSFDYRVVF